MNSAEREIICEIEKYKKLMLETNSQTRKLQLQKHIHKLEKDLKIYSFLKIN